MTWEREIKVPPSKLREVNNLFYFGGSLTLTCLHCIRNIQFSKSLQYFVFAILYTHRTTNISQKLLKYDTLVCASECLFLYFISTGSPTSPKPPEILYRAATRDLQIVWGAPSDWSYCITHYSVYISDSNGTVNVWDTTDNSTVLSVAVPCSDIVVEVSGWSEGGEGEKSLSVMFNRGLSEFIFSKCCVQVNIILLYCGFILPNHT